MGFENLCLYAVLFVVGVNGSLHGIVDEDAISKLECVEDGQYVKLYKAPEGLVGFIDRSTNKSVIGY